MKRYEIDFDTSGVVRVFEDGEEQENYLTVRVDIARQANTDERIWMHEKDPDLHTPIVLAASLLADATGDDAFACRYACEWIPKLKIQLDDTTEDFSVFHTVLLLEPGELLFDFIEERLLKEETRIPKRMVPVVGLPLDQAPIAVLLAIVGDGKIGSCTYDNDERLRAGEELVRRVRPLFVKSEEQPFGVQHAEPSSDLPDLPPGCEFFQRATAAEPRDLPPGAVSVTDMTVEACREAFRDRYQYVDVKESGTNDEEDPTFSGQLWNEGYRALPPNVEVYRCGSYEAVHQALFAAAAIAFPQEQEDGS